MNWKLLAFREHLLYVVPATQGICMYNFCHFFTAFYTAQAFDWLPLLV